MSLFERWSGKIIIPALPAEKIKIGQNTIVQESIPPFEVTAKLYDSQISGYWFLRTDTPQPFDSFYLRENRAKRKPVDRAVLITKSSVPVDLWDINTKFGWDNAAYIGEHFNSPEKVTKSWKDQFRFQLEDRQMNIPGLRRPQIGALHAILAHFAVGQDQGPATVVLPTGTGKTETMISALVCAQSPRLLVLVPTDILRRQIAEKFETLGLLRELKCLPGYACSPRVARITKGIRTIEEAKHLLANANVMVALPQTLEASDKGAAFYLCKECSTLFVDEAHHIKAQTWESVRDRFVGKQVVQFTATPFRNDRKHIGGKIIFNYKLSDAQKDQFYKPIRLKTVEEFGEEDLRNRAIAEKAISVLREDRKSYDHLLMARVKNRQKAEELLPLYQKLAPEFRPVVVYSGSGRMRENKNAFKSLRDKSERGSKIVICVNMLGEGFDLPELKVAAVHDNHKSLAVTLQFIGRFTRRGENVGNAAVVINIADPDAEKRLQELYAEGADWDHLVSRLSENQISSEIRLQELVESLKASGDLHGNISLWNLRPMFSTQIYRTTGMDWSPLRFEDAFPGHAVLWHSLSSDPHVLVVVAQQQHEVRWGKYENIQEITYDLLLAYWDQDQNALFMHASDYDRMKVSRVAKIITSDDTRVLNGPRVFNVLNNVQLPLVKSLGSSRFGAISFTSYFGPNVTEGLADIEKRHSELNYIGCLGYEDGERVLWGAANRKAKIWQRCSGSIDEWMAWCGRTYNKLMDDSNLGSNITRDFLRPDALTALYKMPPIAVQWGEYIQSSFSNYLSVLFGKSEVPLYFADMEIVDATDEAITIAFFTNDFRSVYNFRIGDALPKGYSYELQEGPPIAFRINRHTIRDFNDQMYKDPLIVRYVDGTYSYNNYHIPIDLGADNYPAERIEVWDWHGVALDRESMGIGVDKNTIQYRTYENLAGDFDAVVNDDGPGEAGDLVCLRDISPDTIELCLVHCKSAYGGKVSGDIRNLYTVCGQAQKSITTKHQGIKKLSLDIRRRHQKWVNRGGSRFLKGDLTLLSYFAEKSRKAQVKFEVIVVQPGISRSSLTSDMAKLLGTTELFLKKTTEAEFRVISSE